MTKKIILTIFAIGILFPCFSQSSNFFKKIKIDAKLFSGCNTTFMIDPTFGSPITHGSTYGKEADYYNKMAIYFMYDYMKRTTISYSGGLEASLRYAFEDSKSEISLGLGYLYQPLCFTFYLPVDEVNGKFQRGKKINKISQFHYLDFPINWYYNLKKGFVLNTGLSFKKLLYTNISNNPLDHTARHRLLGKEDYTYQKNKYSLILGIGNRITEHLSVFLKINLDTPGFIKVKERKYISSYLSSRTYSNINTCIYLTYTF